jgi:hypothetical protein
MTDEERVEDLRAIWGPPPAEPGARSVWEHAMRMLAVLPDAVADLVEVEGTTQTSLPSAFGPLLPQLEADVVWRFLCVRAQEDVRDAVVDVFVDPFWQVTLHGRTAVQRSRLMDRLADDVADNLGRIALIDPR